MSARVTEPAVAIPQPPRLLRRRDCMAVYPEQFHNRLLGRAVRHFSCLICCPLELYGGYLRFQYDGFWFSVVDPWPEYWSDDWYDNDDVYIDYPGDGYHLYNRRYPQDRLAVSISLN